MLYEQTYRTWLADCIFTSHLNVQCRRSARRSLLISECVSAVLYTMRAVRDDTGKHFSSILSFEQVMTNSPSTMGVSWLVLRIKISIPLTHLLH